MTKVLLVLLLSLGAATVHGLEEVYVGRCSPPNEPTPFRYPTIQMRNYTDNDTLIDNQYIWTRRDDGTVSRNLPIADAQKYFEYWYDIEPDTTDIFQVQYQWRFLDTLNPSVRLWDKDAASGQGMFAVVEPDGVGNYTLEVTLSIFDAARKDELATDVRTHALYKSWKNPIAIRVSGQNIGTDVPRSIWMEKAIDWAQGMHISESDVLAALAASIHAKNNWGFYAPPDECFGNHASSLALIQEESNCTGNCAYLFQVLQILAAVLGIKVERHLYKLGSYNSFLTSTRQAIDDNYSANVVNHATGAQDRWKFNNHVVGSHVGENGVTWYYDPTFGLASTDDAANAFGKVPDGVNSVTKLPVEFDLYGRVETSTVWIKERDKGEIPTDPLQVYEYGTDNPQQLVQDVHYSLAKVTILDAQDKENMDTAMTKISDAITHWDVKSIVFKRLQQAVRQLRRIEDIALGPTVRDVIDLLVLAVATLARNAIDDATDANAKAAEAEMSRALEHLAEKTSDGKPAPRPDLAIASYASAYEKAVGEKRVTKSRVSHLWHRQGGK